MANAGNITGRTDKDHDYLRKGEEVDVFKSLVSGGLSGLAARNVTAPLDTLKIRLQTTVALKHNGKFIGESSNVVNLVSSMVRREGIRAFWKGNISGSTMYVVYGGVQFASYSIFNKQLEHYTKSYAGIHSALVGGLSGMTSSICSYPFDLLRTRFIANKQFELLSLRDGIRDIWKHEGFKGFYHGSVSAMISISISTSVLFGSYEAIRIFCENKTRDKLDKTANISDIGFYKMLNSCASSISGTLAKLVTFPLDTVRRRILLKDSIYLDKFLPTDIPQQPKNIMRNYFAQAKENNKTSRVFFKMASQMVRQEGISSFYKGLSMALIKSIPSTAVSIWSYETIMRVID